MVYNRHVSDDAAKPVLLVKKSDSNKGSLWNTLTNRRIIKQHGGFDIPKDDLHAIPKYENPVHTPQASLEETNSTLSDLEKEIQQLKEKDNQKAFQQQKHDEAKKHFEDEQMQNFLKDEDDLD